MKLRDIMNRDVVVVDQKQGVVEAARMLRDRNVGCLIVADGGDVQGVVTDRDLAIGCIAEGHDCRECHVGEHMSSPAETAQADMDILEAAHFMTEKQIKRLPIQDGDELVGLVSFSDIAHAMQEPMRDLLAGMGAARRGG